MRIAVLEGRSREGKPDTGPLVAGSWSVEVSQLISVHFSDEELRELCLLLGVDFESLGGDGKKARALRLVMYMERFGRSDELLERLAELRVKVVWPTV